ncbi:MAG: hypothetical protein ABI237_18315 [Ginsengibacter sp.]
MNTLILKSKIVTLFKIGLFAMLTLVLGVLLAIITGLYFNLPGLAIAFYLFAFLSLFLIIKKLKKRFISNIEIELNDLFFKIVSDDINKKESITIYWKDIKSYKPRLSNGLLTRGFLVINFKLRKGFKKICLFDETLSKTSNTTNSLCDNSTFLVFQQYISYYNRSTSDIDEQIILLPNFFASQSGYYSIIFLTALIGFDIIYRITHHLDRSNIGIIVTVIIMYIGILFKRKNDQKLYEELISKN